jgi:polysaccharide export outer membrane protein
MNFTGITASKAEAKKATMAKVWGFVSILLFIALAGCSWLPSAGPTSSGVVDRATGDNGEQRFLLVNVNDAVVRALQTQPKPSFRASFGGYGPPPPHRISVGDTIRVSIWEAAGGTLFSQTPVIEAGAGGAVAGSRGTTIPEQIVLTDGAITVPFAGRINVLGMTAEDVARDIERRLSKKATEPQIIVTVPRSASDSVTVTGEVVKGAVVSLTPNGNRILDAIALVGGSAAPAYETFVRLSRKGTSVTVPLQQLIDDPGENVYVWPGDVLTLVRIPQAFEAFGATGRNSEIAFDQRNLTLVEALAKSAGLNNDRADPAGVFLLRIENESTVRAMNRQAQVRTPNGGVPVIYHINMQDPKGYFLARQFPIEDKDVIYVANAKTDSIHKFFEILSTLASPVLTGIITLQQIK